MAQNTKKCGHSTFLSYQTYTQIWISIKAEKISVGGQTNRSKSRFEVEFKKSLKRLEF